MSRPSTTPSRNTPVVIDDNDVYKTDIELVMDFMKLALAFDKPNVSQKQRKVLLDLQQKILELLPVAQSNRMEAVYKMMEVAYRINTDTYAQTVSSVLPTTLDEKEKTEEHAIVLFYRSSCPACQSILPIWKEYKSQNISSPFTIAEYDADEPSNASIFRRFNISAVPTVLKLRIGRELNVEKLKDPITSSSLSSLSVF